MITLDRAEIGKEYTITKLITDQAMRSRLRELGMIKGTTVTALCRGFGGEMLSFRIRGATIALRKETATKIYASPV